MGSVVSAIGGIITAIVTGITDIILIIINSIVAVSNRSGNLFSTTLRFTLRLLGPRDDLGLDCGYLVLPLVHWP